MLLTPETVVMIAKISPSSQVASKGFRECDVTTHGPNKRGKILFVFFHFRTNIQKGPKIPKTSKKLIKT